MKFVRWRHWCMKLRCIQWTHKTNFSAPGWHGCIYDSFWGPGKKLEFFMYFELRHIARETCRSTPHYFERHCFSLWFAPKAGTCRTTSQDTKLSRNTKAFVPTWRQVAISCPFQRHLSFLFGLRSGFQITCSACAAGSELRWRRSDSDSVVGYHSTVKPEYFVRLDFRILRWPPTFRTHKIFIQPLTAADSVLFWRFSTHFISYGSHRVRNIRK